MKFLAILIIGLGLSSCKPEQEETLFNEVLIGEAEAVNASESEKKKDSEPGNPQVVSVCSEIQDKSHCEKAPECQPVIDESSQEMVSCVETPIQRPPGGGGGEVGGGGEGGEETEANLACQNIDEGEQEEEQGEEAQEVELEKPAKAKAKPENKKVAVCHIPPGNPAALHTICISINGWENGHKGRHGNEESQDYLGACTQRDLDVLGAQE